MEILVLHELQTQTSWLPSWPAAFEVACCFRGALPPVDLRAVCFVRSISENTHFSNFEVSHKSHLYRPLSTPHRRLPPPRDADRRFPYLARSRGPNQTL
jgi:hypothetical protein